MKRLISVILLATGVSFAQAQFANKSQDSFTAAGTGASHQAVTGVVQNHGVHLIVTGAPVTCTFQLQGSIDGVNWGNLGTSQTCTSSILFFVTASPVVYYRGNLTALSGGTSPTVTFNYAGVN